MAELEFQTQPIILGAGGLDVFRSVDQVDVSKFVRLTNLDKAEDGAFITRPGQQRLFIAPGAKVHSIGRLDV